MQSDLSLVVAVFLNLTNEKVKPWLFFTKCALLILDDPINIIDYGNMLIFDADCRDMIAPMSSCHGDEGVIKSRLKSWAIEHKSNIALLR